MVTYENVIKFLNENYFGPFRLEKENPGNPDDQSYIITNDGSEIKINEDRYSSSLYIDAKLGRILLDLLNTPFNKRFELEHDVDPVTMDDMNNKVEILNNADEVIDTINEFILKEFKLDPDNHLVFMSTLDKDKLEKIILLFDDFCIDIESVEQKDHDMLWTYNLDIDY